MLKPSEVRLSNHFLLSDFIGCHSVYVKGYANVFDLTNKKKLQQGKYLAEYLETVLEQYGPLSISYGYISPELSQKVVTYQDPNKPSYHRWDIGAAADICVHNWVQKVSGSAPIHLANEIDFNPDLDWYSRMITYSESPYICVATNLDENQPRRAFYENRYEGVRKPVFITKPRGRTSPVEVELEHHWHGAGYPTYHGGGVRQLQHIRVGLYSMLTDFLYSDIATQNGYKNAGIPTEKMLRKFRAAGRAYADLVAKTGIRRFSIVRGYEHPSWKDKAKQRNWDDLAWFDIVVPADVNVLDVTADALVVKSILAVSPVKTGLGGRLRIGAGETI